MAYLYPKYPGEVQGGDEATYSPGKTQHSLLGAERGTQVTRRLETDSNNNLFVSIGSVVPGTLVPGSVSAVAVGAVTSLPASTVSTIVTLTAGAAIRLTRISVSGTDYAKFLLFKNATLIETKRTGPDRSTDFMFNSPLDVASGDVIDVKVIHYATGVLADFESTIYGA